MKKRVLCLLLAAAMAAAAGTTVFAADGTQEIMSTGPNGETATPATELSLTDEEIAKDKGRKLHGGNQFPLWRQ